MKISLNKTFFTKENTIIVYIVVVKILIHLLNPEYGYFRDEFFYLAIGDQFSLYNLDVLPLTPLFLKVFTAIFGYSIKSLHFASSLCGAMSIVLVCLLTRDLGGKKYAILLTGVFMMLSGTLIFGAIFTYDSLDFLIWISALYLLVRIFKENKLKLWILLGLVLGLGLFNKLTILFLGLAIFVCLWLVPQRVYFKKMWIWLAGVIALLFSIPFVIWQFSNNWYFVEVAADYSGGLAYVPSFLEYLWGQILPNNIFLLPVWATGLGLLLFSSKWKQFRFFGFTFTFLFFLFYFIGAKFYFLIPMYSILIAVGSIKIEEYFNKQRVKKIKIKIAKITVPIAYVILSLPLLPLIMPIIPVGQLVKFAAVMGVDAGVPVENQRLTNLPQHMADRFGWEEMVVQIADIYNNGKGEEENEVGIITNNWGQAGAIHLLGKKYDLPEPISMHGWYYFESLRTHEFKNVYITIGLGQEDLNYMFDDVELKGIYTNPYCMPYENNKSIYLCRKPKYNLRDFWIVARNINPVFLEVLNYKGVNAAIDYYYESKKIILNPYYS